IADEGVPTNALMLKQKGKGIICDPTAGTRQAQAGIILRLCHGSGAPIAIKPIRSGLPQLGNARYSLVLPWSACFPTDRASVFRAVNLLECVAGGALESPQFERFAPAGMRLSADEQHRRAAALTVGLKNTRSQPYFELICAEFPIGDVPR